MRRMRCPLFAAEVNPSTPRWYGNPGVLANLDTFRKRDKLSVFLLWTVKYAG